MQGSLFVVTLILWIGNIVSLSTGTSLYELLGDGGCFVFWAALVLIAIVTYTSSFCMSLLRYICIVHVEKALILGMDRIKRFVFVVEATIYVITGLFYALVYAYGSAPLAMTFCYNKSKTFLEVLTHHENPTNVGHLALMFVLAFQQTLGILEFIMYVILFKTLWKHDQTMKESLSKEHIKSRNKTNVITLVGQAWGFLMEVITLTILLFAINLEMDSVFLQPQIATFYVVIHSTAISVGQFVTSPDMRKFYMKSD